MSLEVPVRETGMGLSASLVQQRAGRLAAGLERVLDLVTGSAVAVMAGVIAYQVFGRYVLDRSPSWSEELARYLLIWMTMLGSAAVLRSGRHIAVTVLVDALGPGSRRAILAVRDAVLVTVSGLLAWWGLAFARLNATQDSPGMEIPMSIPYAALPAGAVLIVILVLLARLAGTGVDLHGEESA